MSMTGVNESRVVRQPKSLGGLNIAVLPLIVLLPIALMGPNTLLALYACAGLFIGFILLWRPFEPQILLFIFLYQWVQAAIGTFYSNLAGLPVEHLTQFPGKHEDAVAFLVTGLVVLAAAMRVAAGRARTDLAGLIREMVSAYPARTWVAVYIAAWLFSSVCAMIAPLSGGLRQVFLILAELKWAAFVLLTVYTFGEKRRSKASWLVAFILEFALAVGGFFAEFSSVFYYSLIGIAFAGGDILKRNKMVAVVIVVGMLTFAVAWTAVKRDYRDFINAGTREQVVLVGYQDRISDLFDRMAGLNAEKMSGGVDQLIRRLSYFEFFGIVLQRNAMGQPHSGGEIWGWGATSPFMPRILFPDKPIADDTALMMEYTGLKQAAWSKGTSISLGYMAEAFIDFGRWGMFVAIGVLGLAIGMIYRWLLRQKGWRLLVGSSLVSVALMPAHLLEISAVKLLPALALSVIAGWITLGLLAPMVLRWAGVIRRKPMATVSR